MALPAVTMLAGGTLIVTRDIRQTGIVFDKGVLHYQRVSCLILHESVIQLTVLIVRFLLAADTAKAKIVVFLLLLCTTLLALPDICHLDVFFL